MRELLYVPLVLLWAGVVFGGLWVIWHAVGVWRESRKRR